VLFTTFALLPLVNTNASVQRQFYIGKKKSSNKAAARKRFPVGELSRKRQELKEIFLAKNASLEVVKKDIDKVSKRVSTESSSNSTSTLIFQLI
jgi:hypothetical protein